jgi:hypothetical protein
MKLLLFHYKGNLRDGERGINLSSYVTKASEQAGLAVKPWAHILEVFGSYFGQETDYIEGFVVYLSPSGRISE